MATKSIGSNVLVIVIAIALVFAGGMFFAGMKYGESKNSSSSNSPLALAGRGGNFIRRGSGTTAGGGGFATGSIISKDSQSITVKMPDGSSKTAYFSGSTQVGKFDSGSTSDLATGQRVMVSGTANPDGSIAAKNIEIQPAGSPALFGGGRGAGGGQGGGQQNGG